MRSLVRGLAVGLALSLPSAAVLAQAPAAETAPGEDPVVVMAEPAPIASAPPAAENDYPTAVRAEYVFACMATNGQTQDALTRCSCSIDQIAGILPYDAYVEAETVLRMRLAARRARGDVPRYAGGAGDRRDPAASAGRGGDPLLLKGGA